MNEQRHFAPVVPLSIARWLKKIGHLGNYHLLLAHDVLEHPEEYKDIYANQGMDIIMDNSLIELGYPMQVRDVLEAAHIVGAKRIVLPDVLGDIKQTLDMVYQSYETFYRLPYDVKANTRLVGVVQGNTLDECRHCMFEYMRMGMDLSIPRVLVKLLGTRSEIVQAAYIAGARNMHLLGFSENILDDVMCARMPGIKGIDSAVPIRAGIKEIDLTMEDPFIDAAIGPRGNFWDLVPEDFTTTQCNKIGMNLYKFREWINR